MLALCLAVLIVQGVNITGYPAVGDDEGTYLAQAWSVQQGDGLAHYTYWYDHPPLGWLQIAALSWIPGQLQPAHLTVANARIIMLPFALIAVGLLYVLGRRLALPRWAAASGAVLFALSPLAATLQRQIYLDNIAVVWMLGAFVLALSPKRHLWHHMAAGCCAAVAILSKETMLVVLPALLVALWQGSHPEHPQVLDRRLPRAARADRHRSTRSTPCSTASCCPARTTCRCSAASCSSCSGRAPGSFLDAHLRVPGDRRVLALLRRGGAGGRHRGRADRRRRAAPVARTRRWRCCCCW